MQKYAYLMWFIQHYLQKNVRTKTPYERFVKELQLTYLWKIIKAIKIMKMKKRLKMKGKGKKWSYLDGTAKWPCSFLVRWYFQSILFDQIIRSSEIIDEFCDDCG